jgi:hypothetical protein
VDSHTTPDLRTGSPDDECGRVLPNDGATEEKSVVKRRIKLIFKRNCFISG